MPVACLGDLAAFARDVARNLVGVDPSGLTDAEVLALVQPMLALGEADPRVGELLVALAAGNLDRAAWASLPADDALAAAFVDEVAIRLGGFPVDCGLVARLALAPDRTVLELAIRVDRSHGDPLVAAGVTAQPPERKQLATEVAMSVDDFLGLSAGGGQRGELPGDDSVVSTRASLVPRGLQLLSAFRAAERARRTFPGRAVEEAVWRYRPHETLAFDWLLALLGSSSTGAALVGPAGGRVCATGGATGACVDIPAGALTATVLVRIGLAPPELSPQLEPGRTAVGPLIEVEPDVALSIPATLTLPYWPELLRILLVREEDVRALSVDAGGGWSVLDASRPRPGIVSTVVEHFSPYQVVITRIEPGQGSGSSGAPGRRRSRSPEAGRMPSLLHEALLLLFRNRPTLAPELLRDSLGVELPEHEEVRLEDANLTQVVPTAYHADLVILLLRGAPVFGIVVEAQLGRDEEKRFTWPLYAAALRARLRCPACVLIVAPDPHVAAWASQPVETGQPRSPYVPLVLGPQAVPLVTDGEGAARAPELAVLSALAHGQEERAVEVAVAALGVAAGLDQARALLYTDLVYAALNEAARRALEELMADGRYEYQSEFARKYFGEGKAEGKAEGLAEGLARGKAEVLLKILAGRGLALTGEQRSRVLACRDVDQLDGWIDRAFQAPSADEVLGS